MIWKPAAIAEHPSATTVQPSDADSLPTVLIVDDHALYREGLREIIARWDEFSVVGEAENGQEAVEFCRKYQPDLVLMDLKMPIMDGITALSIITKESPSTAVVMLSVYEGEQDVMSAILAGARGYVLKSSYSRQLHHRLRSVIEGNCTLSEEAATHCMEHIRKSKFQQPQKNPENRNTLGLLTNHERQVLSLIAMGASNRDIAERLYISESTVKKQVSFILTKLGLENRVQAAVFALRAGLTE